MRPWPLLLLIAACNGKSVAVAPPVDAGVDATPPTSPKEAVKDAAPTCPALDPAKMAAFERDDTIISAAVPPIVDPKALMAPFYAKVAALARGTAPKHVRIGMYGDSALTADATTGRLRRQLQKRFGDGGHGYVALARPWEWYSHNDVHHDGTWKLFKWVATSTNRVIDNQYGFAGIAADSANEQAAAWVSTDPKPGAPIGFTASHFEVFYARRPDGGRFTIELDGKEVKEVDTRSTGAWEAGFESVDAPDAHHELRMKIKNHGTVRLYGTTIERDAPSIIVDSLGVGAGNMEQLTYAKPETRTPQLQRRNYDLVIIQLGTNMFGGDAVEKKNAKTFLDYLHATLPGVPVLLFTPPDSIEPGSDNIIDTRIFSLVKTFEEIAAADDTALWNYHEAMGGKKSIFTFTEKKLVEGDRVHLKKQGFEIMADRFLVALWNDLGKYVAANPTAGCP